MQTQKVHAKKSFRVDELAKELGVKKFIIKNWEKQFDLKKCGLDNKYSQEDFKIFATIKTLVFTKKMSQSLVKKHLQDILAGKEFIESNQELAEQVTHESSTSLQPTHEEFDQITQQLVKSQLTTQDAATQETAAQPVAIQEIAGKDIASQNIATQDIAAQELTMQDIATQNIATQDIVTQNIDEQDIFEIICKQEQQIKATPAEDIAVEELVQAIIDKELTSETKTTFHGAHEDLQSENIVENSISDDISQIDFADKSEEALPEEVIQQDVFVANSVENITDIKPAFKEKEAFIKNIQSFKEQLLKIHEQLK